MYPVILAEKQVFRARDNNQASFPGSALYINILKLVMPAGIAGLLNICVTMRAQYDRNRLVYKLNECRTRCYVLVDALALIHPTELFF